MATAIITLLLLLSICASAGYLFNRYEDKQEKLSTARVGKFVITWDSADPFLLITHSDEPDRVLFQTLPGWPFLTIGYATDTNPPIVDGNFKVNEWLLYETPHQNIRRVSFVSDTEFVFIGEVWGLVTFATYEVKFHLPTGFDGSTLQNQLAFEANVQAHVGTFNRIFLNYWCDSKESFHGFGAQYTYWDMKGRRVPILVAEQGIGRGKQPITALLNLIGDSAGGDWSTTYAPKPLYITNMNRGLIIENSGISFFDFRDDDAVVVEVWSSQLKGRILHGKSMLELISQVTMVTGRMKPLPDWTQQGAIVGLEGGTEHVRQLTNKILQHKPYGVPVAGIWLQDWVGIRTSYDGDRLSWNWQKDFLYYPDWATFVKDLRSKNVRVLTYINPYFASPRSRSANSKLRKLNAKITKKEEWEPIKCSCANLPAVSYNEGGCVPTQRDGSCTLTENELDQQYCCAQGKEKCCCIDSTLSTSGSVETNCYLVAEIQNILKFNHTSSVRAEEERPFRDLYLEGVTNNYFVQAPAHLKGPYKLRSGSIEFCMLDTTNPFARKWMKELIKEEMIRGTKTSGWMADFGEYLPFDAVLYSGEDPAIYHNLYPQAWAQINSEAIAEAKAELEKSKGGVQKILPDSSPQEEEVVHFVRSGWLQTPQYTAVYWLGDQLVTWDNYDGIKTVVIGALTSGLSGHALTHSDIGGYTMQESGPVLYIRSKELLLRWIELASFGSALFRTHVGLKTSDLEAQVYGNDPTITTHFAKFTRIYQHLSGYRKLLMTEANRYGWPLIRSMAAHFPDDAECWKLSQQYMFGSEFLFAPALDPIQKTKKFATPVAHNSLLFRNIGGVSSVKVYIPAGTSWIHVWSGQHVSSLDGHYMKVDSPIAAPPLFYRDYCFNVSSRVSSNSSLDLSNSCVVNSKRRWSIRFDSLESTEVKKLADGTDRRSVGYKLREFIKTLELEVEVSDYNIAANLSKVTSTQSNSVNSSNALMGKIRDYTESKWFDWLNRNPDGRQDETECEYDCAGKDPSCVVCDSTSVLDYLYSDQDHWKSISERLQQICTTPIGPNPNYSWWYKFYYYYKCIGYRRRSLTSYNQYEINSESDNDDIVLTLIGAWIITFLVIVLFNLFRKRD